MQKTFLTAAALATFALTAVGQGVFTFSANTNGLDGPISYSTDGVASTPYPGNPGLPTYGNANIGFFTAPAGTALTLAGGLPDFTASWSPVLANSAPLVLPLGGGAPGLGNAFAESVMLPVTAGNPIEIEVVAWSGAFTSWAAAVGAGDALLGYSGETFDGTKLGALGWSQPTSTGVPIPASLQMGPSGFMGIVLLKPVGAPEPSTFAIGGLGIGVLALVRRLRNRKSAR